VTGLPCLLMARSVTAGTQGHFRTWGWTGCSIRLPAIAALDPVRKRARAARNALPIQHSLAAVSARRAPHGQRRISRADGEPADRPLRSQGMPAHLIPRRERSPVPKPQKIVDLSFSPAMILGRERIDASIDADIANTEIRTLDKVRYLINGSSAETTFGSCHRRAPSHPSQRLFEVGSQLRKWFG
jgi:hypothetical protein